MKVFIILLLFTFNIGLAQQYIVRTNNDTLYGKTKRIKTDGSDNFVKFKLNGTDKVVKIPLKEILVYQGRNQKLSYPFKNPNGWWIFFSKRISGSVELYSVRVSTTHDYGSLTETEYVLKTKKGHNFFNVTDMGRKNYLKKPFTRWLKLNFKEFKDLWQEYEESKMQIDDVKQLITKVNLIETH